MCQSNQEAGKRIIERSSLVNLIIESQKNPPATNTVTRSNKPRVSLPQEFTIDPEIYNDLRIPIEVTSSTSVSQVNITSKVLESVFTLDCSTIMEFDCFEDLVDALNSGRQNVSLVLRIQDNIEANSDLSITYLSVLPDDYSYEHILIPLREGINLVPYNVILNRDNRPFNQNSFYKSILRSAVMGCQRNEEMRRFASKIENYDSRGNLITTRMPLNLRNQYHSKPRFFKVFRDAVQKVSAPVLSESNNLIRDFGNTFNEAIERVIDIAENPIEGVTSLVIDSVVDVVQKGLTSISLSARTLQALVDVVLKAKNPLSAAPLAVRLIVSQVDFIRFTALPFPDEVNPTTPIFRAIAKIAIAFSDDAFGGIDTTEASNGPVKDNVSPVNLDNLCALSQTQFYIDCIKEFNDFVSCQLTDEFFCERTPLQSPPTLL